MYKKFLPICVAILLRTANASGIADPFSTGEMVPPLPCGASHAADKPYDLADVVSRALCNNPQTREAWANAEVQAEQVGIAKSAYLPTFNANVNPSLNKNSSLLSRLQGAGSSVYSQTSTSLTLSLLLYDFGARRAALENAEQTLKALNETQDATMQGVFLAAVQAYYQLFATQALLEASVEAEKSGRESYDAASTRNRVGTATPADELQAKTALEQAVLKRITAQGNEKIAEGTLANAMGLDAGSGIRIESPGSLEDEGKFAGRVDSMMEEAKRIRPDLLAAKAQLEAAKANVLAAEATGSPTITLSASQNYTHSSVYDPYSGTSLGLAINFPIFTGFNTTYRMRAAKAQVEASQAQVEKISQQVTLDVWRAYQNLVTATETLKSTATLLESAIQAERVALGRYKAGVGIIVDLLTAQSALASARQQRAQALYTWQIDKAILAQAMGNLNAIPAKE